ncbi:MAG: Asp-tRNA(Asn)/Glu-tRNA(Gln) amidotransferase subunit GatC [Candidatus Kerfeldbacteria bacterium]|nr:Asp-tRNA(Asn)/Glu-tRNA(Gln) amidotransferase subunit GatC [Candidatus Kerfeldbacteria bacterium]
MSESKNQLSKEEVLHLAKLARLELTAAEVAKFRGELESILGYLEKLQTLPRVAGVAQPSDSASHWRDDAVEVTPGAAELIKSTPQHQDNLLKVPKIFGE